MECVIEYTDEFGAWWNMLNARQQRDVFAYVKELEAQGVQLGHPYSSAINGSRHGHMRELRVQSGGRPLRVFYAFDPRRMAMLLIAGDKDGRRSLLQATYSRRRQALRRTPGCVEERRIAAMTGHTPFQVLIDKMTPVQRAKAEKRRAELREEMALHELRQARQFTQENLGETLQVGQAAIAKMEKRADMYVSNLRRFVEAMGGELEIIARFPDRSVKINNFGDIGSGASQVAEPPTTFRRNKR